MPMADDSRSSVAPDDAPSGAVPAGDGRSPIDLLPTLQRNALRKIFDRQHFTPEEVAALGYRRLQQAEGIGSKGLQAISDWLRSHGFALTPPEPAGDPRSVPGRKMQRSIEVAVRLLQTHGYLVQPRLDDGAGESGNSRGAGA